MAAAVSAVFLLTLGFIQLPAMAEEAFRAEQPQNHRSGDWKALADGLALGEFNIRQTFSICNHPTIVLRIDPQKYNLKLLSASECGGRKKTAKEWAEDFGMIAVINASMYLPDHRTSTGYMKNFGHVNNGVINPRFGAFLAFNPVNDSVPPVQIIDRYGQDWQNLIHQYQTVIQNYRMISLEGSGTWAPSDQKYSIAAVGMDKTGRLLFIHSQCPFSVYDFNQILLSLPIGIRNAMYVEGGPEACLYLKINGKQQCWGGGCETGVLKAYENQTLQPIPNVIGITRKQDAMDSGF